MQWLKDIALSMVPSLATLVDWTKAGAFYAIAALAPVHAMMITVGVLIFLDLVTGIWASIKRGDKVTSAAMRRTISKILIYNIAVITGFLLEKYLIGGIVPASNLIAGTIGIIETISILENGNSILGDNIFSIVIAKLKLKLGSDNDPKKIVEEVVDQKPKVDKPD